jgi:hypothetical protein
MLIYAVGRCCKLYITSRFWWYVMRNILTICIWALHFLTVRENYPVYCNLIKMVQGIAKLREFYHDSWTLVFCI